MKRNYTVNFPLRGHIRKSHHHSFNVSVPLKVGRTASLHMQFIQHGNLNNIPSQTLNNVLNKGIGIEDINQDRTSFKTYSLTSIKMTT